MILWLVLFLLIVFISFVLAYQSMKNFQEQPENFKLEYALYLVRNPLNLTFNLLDHLHNLTVKEGQIISLEKLFKGGKKALVVFGPKMLLEPLTDTLKLLELEDYTNVPEKEIQAWEMGVKDPIHFYSLLPKVSKQIINLADFEQLWMQIVLQADSKKNWSGKGNFLNLFGTQNANYQRNLNKMLSLKPEVKQIFEQKNNQKTFQAQIRMVLVSESPERRKNLSSEFEDIDEGKLVKLPRPFPSSQMLSFYKTRAKNNNLNSLMLTSQDALTLISD